MSNISEKTINHLLTKVSDLEFEVERQERIINEAKEYIKESCYDYEYDTYSNMFTTEVIKLLDILQDKKKTKEKK